MDKNRKIKYIAGKFTVYDKEIAMLHFKMEELKGKENAVQE